MKTFCFPAWLVVCIALGGCASSSTTTVQLVVAADPGIVGITKLECELDVGGSGKITTLDASGGVALVLPLSTTVTVTHSGALVVNAVGFDSLGNAVAHGTTDAVIVAGKTTQVALTLSAGPGNFSFDMAMPNDLSVPGDLGSSGTLDMPPPPLVTNKVDVLFMVDNSSSMTAMQAQLQLRFASFFDVFSTLAANGIYADLHIGVVTSDYGAGNTAVVGGCDASPGGQLGYLQAVGASPSPGCMAPMGAPYIQYTFGAGGTSTASNLPSGQSITSTFDCMASVGALGCGFEHQLESVYAALHNTVQNAGFLRDDALLAVVFLTNEDDGSAPPTTNMFNQADTAEFGAYSTYRQTEFGVACGTPLMLTPYASSAPLTMCQAAPNTAADMVGQEYDVSRYINYFSQPKSAGGIKANPLDVILVGIDGPPTPVQIVTVDPTTGQGKAPNPAFVACSPVTGTTCQVRLQHSCQNNFDPAFFGDPAVRLNTVINAAPLHQVSSICGSDLSSEPDFSTALSQIGTILTMRLQGK